MALACILLSVNAAIAQENEAPKPPALPAYGPLMLTELLLPGSAHIALGNKRQGILTLCLSLPLIGIGQGLIWSAYLSPGEDIDIARLMNGYAFLPDSAYAESLWMISLGRALDAAGRAVAAYSAYSAAELYRRRLGADQGSALSSKAGADPVFSLGEALSAPFMPKNILNPWVLSPILAYGTADVIGGSFERTLEFFDAEEQPFWGKSYSPVTALAFKLITSLIGSYFNALAQEIYFRGYLRVQDGALVSSFLSGGSSLLSSVVPGNSGGAIILSSLYNSGYAWYASEIAAGGRGGLGRAIALRYWLELSTSLSSYIADPETESGLSFSLIFRY